MAETSIPEGTGSTGPLSVSSAVDHLLATAAPEQEPPAEAEEQPAAEIEADAGTDDAEDDAPVEAVTAEDEDDQDEVSDEDDDDSEEAAIDYYTVKVAGEDVDVTADELIAGYQRSGDYTQKTQALAADRKSVEGERQQFAQAQQELHQMRQHLAARLQQAEEMLGAGEPEPNWDQLRDEDPLEYMVQRDRFRDRQEQQRQVQTEREALQAQQNHVAQQQRAQHLQSEQAALLERIPEWQDEAVATKEKSAVVTYAQRAGFSEQELAQASDSRAVSILRKAMLYDALQDETPKARAKAKAAPKMVRAGKPKSKATSSRRKKADQLNRINKNKGRDAMEAAVEYLLES